MANKVWNAGIGSSTGDPLGTEAPLIVSGTVWYVDSATGNDANSGTREDTPKATLAAAVAAASAQDVIALLPTHDETLTAAIATALAGLTIVGFGSSGGIPLPKLRMNAAAANVLTLTGAGQQIFGIRFQANQQANSGHGISIGAANIRVRNCYFDLGEHDNGAGIFIASALAGIRIEDTTFVSTATSVATRPSAGILVSSSTTYMNISGVTVDAGTYGFSGQGISFSAAATGLHIENLSLLRGADMLIDSASTGFVNVATVTGGSVVTW